MSLPVGTHELQALTIFDQPLTWISISTSDNLQTLGIWLAPGLKPRTYLMKASALLLWAIQTTQQPFISFLRNQISPLLMSQYVNSDVMNSIEPKLIPQNFYQLRSVHLQKSKQKDLPNKSKWKLIQGSQKNMYHPKFCQELRLVLAHWYT